MTSLRTSKHSIDLIFPLSLFFVFAASAIIVLLLAVNIYQSTNKQATSSYETGTSLSYITEKLRQADINDSSNVYIDEFQGCDSLIIEQTINSKTYRTCIYNDDGTIRELYIEAGVTATKSSGTEIMTVGDLTMEELSSGLFKFTCTSEDGHMESSIIGVGSGFNEGGTK